MLIRKCENCGCGYDADGRDVRTGNCARCDRELDERAEAIEDARDCVMNVLLISKSLFI